MTQMTEVTRPDVDIEEDIRNIIAHYPPLQADRHQLRIEVQRWRGDPERACQVADHPALPAWITSRECAACTAIDSDRLYYEETIRLEAGRRIPHGVIANAIYGTVVLTGTLPDRHKRRGCRQRCRADSRCASGS